MPADQPDHTSTVSAPSPAVQRVAIAGPAERIGLLAPLFDGGRTLRGERLLPHARVVGVYITDDGALKDTGSSRLVGTREDFVQLLQHEDVQLVLFLDADAEMAALRPRLPATTSMMDDAGSRFLTMLLDEETPQASCTLDLDRTRRMLETVINEVSDDIMILDAHGTVVFINDRMLTRTGRARNDFLGRNFWDVADPDEALCVPPRTDCPFAQTLASGQPAEAIIDTTDRDGRVRYWKVQTFPIHDTPTAPQVTASEQVTHIAEVRREVTDSIHIEHRLQRSERLAAIGELSTYIAHEIRNPLFAISGFANSLFRSKELQDRDREKVKVILEESRRLDAILKSILDFTRPTEGGEEQVDVTRVARETMELMRLGCEQEGIEVVTRLGETYNDTHTATTPETTPETTLARGDAELIKQSLINLVKNGIEAIRENDNGPKVLTVSTGFNGSHVFLRVADTGCGIAPDDLPRVFNPFFSTKDKGAGLGLAMIKKIVDDIGGEVKLESERGKGTTVTLLLPPFLAVESTEQPASHS